MDATKLQLLNKVIALEIFKWTNLEGNHYRDAEGNIQFLPPYSESLLHAIDLITRFNLGVIFDAATNTYKVFQVGVVAPDALTFEPTTIASDESITVALCLSALKANGIDLSQFE